MVQRFDPQHRKLLVIRDAGFRVCHVPGVGQSGVVELQARKPASMIAWYSSRNAWRVRAKTFRPSCNTGSAAGRSCRVRRR